MGRNVAWGEMSQGETSRGEMSRGETSLGEKRRIALFIGLKLVESPKVKQKQQFFNPLPAIQITTKPLF